MQSDLRRFKKVSVGLGLVLASIVLLLLYFLSYLAWAFAVELLGNIGSLALVKTIVMIQVRLGLPIFVTSTLLAVAGPCLCLAAPREVKGTTYVLISIALNALSLLIIALGNIVTWPVWLFGLAYFLPYISIPFFVLFVRRLSIYLKRDDICKLARGVFAFAGFAAVLVAPTFALTVLEVDPRVQSLVSFVASVLVLIFSVLSLLRFLRMLEYARRATNTAAEGESAKV